MVDSGPGRMNESLLATLRSRGFYLYPGLPNSTHVTQATDRKYGLFKSLYRTNLQKLTDHNVMKKKTHSSNRYPSTYLWRKA